MLVLNPVFNPVTFALTHNWQGQRSTPQMQTGLQASYPHPRSPHKHGMIDL